MRQVRSKRQLDFESDMKTCTACRRELNMAMFNKFARNSDGLSSICRECAAIVRKRYYEANKEKIAAKKHALRNTDEYRTKRNQERRARRAEDGDAVRAKDKLRYEKRKEKVLSLQRMYYKRNREVILERGSQRRMAYRMKAIEDLRDVYVNGLLIQGTALKRKDIPPALTAAKRIQLMIERTVKGVRSEEC